MSPQLPLVSGREVTRRLEAGGFERVSQRGSHLKLRHTDGRVAIVPMHRELARGTLRSILRQANLTAEEFEGLG